MGLLILRLSWSCGFCSVCDSVFFCADDKRRLSDDVRRQITETELMKEQLERKRSELQVVDATSFPVLQRIYELHRTRWCSPAAGERRTRQVAGRVGRSRTSRASRIQVQLGNHSSLSSVFRFAFSLFQHLHFVHRKIMQCLQLRMRDLETALDLEKNTKLEAMASQEKLNAQLRLLNSCSIFLVNVTKFNLNNTLYINTRDSFML